MKNITRHLTFFLAALMLFQIVYYYPLLPAQVASHFDFFGTADGFMAKESYLLFQIGLFLFAVIFPLAILKFIKVAPASTLNIPNKEYWLAEEQREDTFARIGNQFGWFRVLLMSLFLGINQLVINANLAVQPLSALSWGILGIFLVAVFWWTVKLSRQFKIEK